MNGQAHCPLCDYVSGVAYFNARHADKEHTRCSCGWVGVRWRSHAAKASVDVEHTILELLPGPGGQAGELSYRELLGEVDRLKCELIVYADVDTADVEQLRRECDRYRDQAERYRKVIMLQLDADKARLEAERCRSEAYALMIEAMTIRERR